MAWTPWKFIWGCDIPYKILPTDIETTLGNSSSSGRAAGPGTKDFVQRHLTGPLTDGSPARAGRDHSALVLPPRAVADSHERAADSKRALDGRRVLDNFNSAWGTWRLFLTDTRRYLIGSQGNVTSQRQVGVICVAGFIKHFDPCACPCDSNSSTKSAIPRGICSFAEIFTGMWWVHSIHLIVWPLLYLFCSHQYRQTRQLMNQCCHRNVRWKAYIMSHKTCTQFYCSLFCPGHKISSCRFAPILSRVPSHALGKS